MEKLVIGKYYPVALGESVPVGTRHKDCRVKATGEKRQPRKGEYFLSGAIIEGYRAPNDLSTPFHIGELVEGETVWVPKS